MQPARYSLALATFLAILAAGCSDGLKLTPVTGKVTMNGKPIKNVKVDFHPDPDKGSSGPGSSGTTDENGTFTLVCSQGNRPGAIIGHHRVILSDLDVFGNVFVGRGDYRAEDEKKVRREVPKLPRFAKQYSDLAQTPFKEEVKPGMSPVAINIK